jgi:hypothetical protein
MRFANIRLGLIPDMPIVAIASAQDIEKDFQAPVSIFQSKSTKKLGKHSRRLVSMSMASFNQAVSPNANANASSPSAAGAHQQKQLSPAAILAVSPLLRSFRLPPPKFLSPSEWITEQDKPSSDDDS